MSGVAGHSLRLSDHISIYAKDPRTSQVASLLRVNQNVFTVTITQIKSQLPILPDN